ncbi:MAG TPA: hypothetical protein VK843_13945 [Planctomycetota bacterium]|nr:hypothetical protein [Planctomycetota bacterium]
MHLPQFGLFLAPEEPLLQRLGVLAIALIVGAYFILVGRYNVRRREAEETGQRALLLSMWGKSTAVGGRWAVAMGWMRIVVGVAIIAFGFVFMFFGAFLKK